MTTARDRVHAPDKQALKVAMRGLVKAVGGVEAAEGFCRARKSSLSDYGNSHSDGFAPIDVVADLEAITVGLPGWPHVTRKLCQANGGVFVRLPDASPNAHDWHGGMRALAEQSGHVIAEICGSLADDGGVDADEARLIEEKCHAIAASVMAIASLAERVIRGDAA